MLAVFLVCHYGLTTSLLVRRAHRARPLTSDASAECYPTLHEVCRCWAWRNWEHVCASARASGARGDGGRSWEAARTAAAGPAILAFASLCSSPLHAVRQEDCLRAPRVLAPGPDVSGRAVTRASSERKRAARIRVQQAYTRDGFINTLPQRAISRLST